MRVWSRVSFAGRVAAAAAIGILTGAAPAASQSVVVIGATAGQTAELVVDGQKVASTAVDADGRATLAFDVLAQFHKSESGVRVAIDTCVQGPRVQLSEQGVQPPDPDAACSRKSVPDLFSVQSITTLLVDVGRDTPAVWIRQGPAPRSWLTGEEPAEGRLWRQAPTGVVLSAGGGGVRFANAVAQACGDASPCSGQRMRWTGVADATYWLTPYLAASVGYVLPARVTADGSGTAFTFSSTLDARVITFAGKVGGQAGPVRIYGMGGANYSSATSTTVQTATGGAPETFAFRAQGWGWLAGGGAEFWLASHVAVYAEGQGIVVKGSAVDNRQGSLSDTLIVAVAGVRVSLRPAAVPTGR